SFIPQHMSFAGAPPSQPSPATSMWSSSTIVSVAACMCLSFFGSRLEPPANWKRILVGWRFRVGLHARLVAQHAVMGHDKIRAVGEEVARAVPNATVGPTANGNQGQDLAYTSSSHPVTRVTSKPDRKPASVAWRREVTLVRAPKNAATKLSAIATAMAAKNS